MDFPNSHDSHNDYQNKLSSLLQPKNEFILKYKRRENKKSCVEHVMMFVQLTVRQQS